MLASFEALERKRLAAFYETIVTRYVSSHDSLKSALEQVSIKL